SNTDSSDECLTLPPHRTNSILTFVSLTIAIASCLVPLISTGVSPPARRTLGSAAAADCVVATRRLWRDFPFSGLFSLVGALLALLVDLSALSHLKPMATSTRRRRRPHQPYVPIPTTEVPHLQALRRDEPQ
ncbi:Os02g0702700, partial [Oryza sativa Japonica Group]